MALRVGYADPETAFVRKVEAITDGILDTGLKNHNNYIKTVRTIDW